MKNFWDEFNHWVQFLEIKNLTLASLREYKRDVRQFLEWLKESGGGYSSAKNFVMSKARIADKQNRFRNLK